MINLGGNFLQSIQLPIQSEVALARDPYYYSYTCIAQGETLHFAQLQSACIHLLSGNIQAPGAELTKRGDTLQIENSDVVLRGQAPLSYFLLAGHTSGFYQDKQQTFTPYAKIKKVIKPWGHELWITGEHLGYCLKEIFIKKGTRTSLQYHRMKRETNVLFDGTARLYFKAQAQVANDEVKSDDLAFCEMTPMCTIDVYPETLHRLEAVSDILLYEVSTPHLDDVVRVSDDTARGHGRIQSEHS